ncbi:MAG TPA: PHP domain-containing protein [Spirochaetes bacterium]|nr:PHP domain-containing protein [Spirochaetota bacterium]
MTKRIDLHVHTTASDGLYSPVQMVDMAVDMGLCAMAITDHDTVEGLPEACARASERGFNLIPGIEFSIDFPKGTFHLVGLYLNYRDDRLLAALRNLKSLRENRAQRILEDLNKNGIFIPFDEVQKEAAGGSIGKPHFGRVLVRHGYAADLDQVFERFMVDGKPGDVPREKISAREGMELIKGAGGIPVIAHPVSLGLNGPGAYDEFIGKLITMGLRGIEAYAAMHNREWADAFLLLARKHGLLVTGGSDFHGDRGEEIGLWGPEELIPCDLLEALETFRGSG